MFFCFLSFFLTPPYCAETNIELKSCVARGAETGRLLVYFFSRSRLITFPALVLLSADWCLTSGCVQQNGKKEKVCHPCVWLTEHSNEGRIPATQSDLSSVNQVREGKFFKKSFVSSQLFFAFFF